MSVNGYHTKAAAIRALKAMGFKFESALTDPESNPKVAKNGKQGVLSSPLHLAPASLSGFNVCPQASKGCIAACLHTAGNPLYMQAKHASRIEKTKAYFSNRKTFLALVAFDIAALKRKADKAGMLCGVRLNATSDIAWEAVAVEVDGIRYANLMDAFPDVAFYDYSKVTKRVIKFAQGLMPANYHLTFSKTESNDNDVISVLNAGGTVAVVFEKKLPETWNGFPVLNGDDHDFRPLDLPGHVVGLKAKGEAKADQSGFVVRGIAA